MLQALGKQNLNVKRKILVFLLFPTQFCKLGFADPVTTLLNTAATGKTEFKCGKKNACFSAISDTCFQVGFADPGLEVQMTTAKSCCFIQKKNIDISDKTTKRKAT